MKLMSAKVKSRLAWIVTITLLIALAMTSPLLMSAFAATYAPTPPIAGQLLQPGDVINFSYASQTVYFLKDIQYETGSSFPSTTPLRLSAAHPTPCRNRAR